MDAEFWLQRWREGRTGWHHTTVMPLLARHWPTLGVPDHARVLVPLCGKSLDMLWLAQRGHHVLGVELSPIAIEAFLHENHLHARSRATPDGTRYKVTNAPGGGIDIINGDIFAVDPAVFSGCNALYDRAASIALPTSSRDQLAERVYAELPPGSRGLLITLDYPAGEMQGPPFPVGAAEAERLYGHAWSIRQLERRDIFADDPSFAARGASAMHTAVYALTRRAARKVA